ncbi:MAG: lipoprotein-releasing system ATP-binding protein [bacterium]|jgi:lipoprotein-releasing system ATP-binding protein
MSNILEVQELGKTFTDGSGEHLEILHGLNFAFQTGKSTAIIGRSGCGKSTLLNILGGLDKPTKGTVQFHGKNISTYNSNKLADWRNKEIGFIFQFFQLLPDFTALENIMFPALIQGLSANKAEKKAQELLKQVQMDHRAFHKPSKLSGGEQQRISIARALINSPSIILADEPTGNLDENTGEVIRNLLLNVCKEQGKALIMVTHNKILAESLDFCLELSHGNLALR